MSAKDTPSIETDEEKVISSNWVIALATAISAVASIVAVAASFMALARADTAIELQVAKTKDDNLTAVQREFRSCETPTPTLQHGYIPRPIVPSENAYLLTEIHKANSIAYRSKDAIRSIQVCLERLKVVSPSLYEKWFKAYHAEVEEITVPTATPVTLIGPNPPPPTKAELTARLEEAQNEKDELFALQLRYPQLVQEAIIEERAEFSEQLFSE